MPARIDAEKCVRCGACVDECPVGAISLNGDKAVIDEGACIDCGACVATCPNEAISQ